MRQRHSLRFRVAAAFASMGAFLSLLFALGILVAAHDVSNRLMDQTLKEELDDYMARRVRNPQSLPPHTASLRGYIAAVGTPAEGIPAAVRALPQGKHEIVVDGVPFRVAVAERDGERYTFMFSEYRQRRREQRFLGYLIAGALLMTLLAAAGGLWLAARVITPVTELARAVSQASTENPPRLTADDQLHAIAGFLHRRVFLARQKQQSGGQGRHLGGGALDAGHPIGLGFGQPRVFRQHLGGAAYHRQRCTQLVAGVGGEGALALDEGGQPAEIEVEGTR